MNNLVQLQIKSQKTIIFKLKKDFYVFLLTSQNYQKLTIKTSVKFVRILKQERTLNCISGFH